MNCLSVTVDRDPVKESAVLRTVSSRIALARHQGIGAEEGLPAALGKPLPGHRCQPNEVRNVLSQEFLYIIGPRAIE